MLALWAFIQAEYSMEDTLDSIKDSFDELVLKMMNLPLGAPISTSSEIALDSIKLNMADVEVKIFKFTISLLDTTIKDGGMRERSAVDRELFHYAILLFLFLFLFIFIFGLRIKV